jgi:hypothetical protein
MHPLWNWEFSSASGKDNVVGLPLRSGMGGCGEGSRRHHERGKVTAQPKSPGAEPAATHEGGSHRV